MIQFGVMEVEGFCSIANLHINLGINGTTIIRGVNGEGKSHILSALVWGIYGKNLKGISEVNTWRKYRKKDYSGTLLTINYSVDGVLYKVVRCQNYQHKIDGSIGGNRLLLYKDTTLVPEKKKIELQGLIEESLGLSFPLFINSIMFGQGLSRLIQESNAEKKNLFEEVFNLGYISEAREVAKEKMQFAEKQFCKYDNLCSSLKNTLESTTKSHEKAALDYKSFKASQKERLGKLREKKKEAQSKLSQITLPEEDLALSKITSINKELVNATKAKEASIQKLNGLSLEGVVDAILSLLEKQKYTKAIKELKGLRLLISSREVQELHIKGLRDQKYTLEKESREYQDKLRERKNLQERLMGISESIKYMRGIQKPTLQTGLTESIAELQEKSLEASKNLATYKEQYELYKWAFTEPLGNNGIKAYIFESSLSELNRILRGYANSIGISIKFIIDTRNARKDFDTYIEMGGVGVLYEELSGGQKQLVNLAMAFAMNELVTKPKNLNLAFLDEVFESLSYDNIELVVALIKKVFRNKTLFLITHQDNLAIDNARTIKVTKEDGISRYNF